MVLGYLCEEHGYQRECDVDDIGQRICKGCGMAVTGIVGRSRDSDASPPTDISGMMEGDIRWTVDDQKFVDAFDHEEAAQKAFEKYGHFTEIRPTEPSYGRI